MHEGKGKASTKHSPTSDGGVEEGGEAVEGDGLEEGEEGEEEELTAEEKEKLTLIRSIEEVQTMYFKDALKETAEVVCGWAKEHVLKYGLCPLAKDGLETGTTRVIPLPDVADPKAAARAVYIQGTKMLSCSQAEISTTLIAFPSMFPDDPEKWLQFADAVEAMFETDQLGLSNTILVSSYHPEFQWAGVTDDQSAINYEKRSPMPIIKLLRASMIDAAVEKGFVVEVHQKKNEETLMAASQKMREEFEEIEGLEGSAEEWATNDENEIGAYRIKI